VLEPQSLREKQMGETGQVDIRLRSAKDLLAIAEALEREAASRYRGLSGRMAGQGDHEMAALFESLARMEDAHAGQVVARSQPSRGGDTDAGVRWETPPGYDEAEARGATLSRYQALAFAVRNEERAFAFYTYVSAEAESSELRALAEDLARDELEHAALLRQYRRRAFHENRPAALEIPENLAELAALARRRDAEASAAHRALAETLAALGQFGDAERFRLLAEEEAQSAGRVSDIPEQRLKNAIEGLRLLEQGFDHFALIAERSQDEAVVAEAQRLASRMVARLAATGGARNNILLGDEGPKRSG
jgi:rubrerythrin